MTIRVLLDAVASACGSTSCHQMLSSTQDGALQKIFRDTCLRLSEYFGDRRNDSDAVLASSYLLLALVEPSKAIALLQHLNVKVGVLMCRTGQRTYIGILNVNIGLVVCLGMCEVQCHIAVIACVSTRKSPLK